MPITEYRLWSRLNPLPQKSWADPIPHLAFPEGVREALETVAKKFAKDYSTAENKLTEAQLVEAMRQALACGDFLRHVRVDNGGQMITYEPFREVTRLKARIRELEERLKAIAEGKPVINPEWEALGPAMDIVLD